MKIIELAFTVYPLTDVKRARAFYEGTLRLQPGMVHKSEQFSWIEYEVGPGVLALGSGSEFKPSSDGGSVGLEVDEFPAAIEQLKQAGCEVPDGADRDARLPHGDRCRPRWKRTDHPQAEAGASLAPRSEPERTAHPDIHSWGIVGGGVPRSS